MGCEGGHAQGPSIELRHLRAFVAAAEELHFTRAASRLHLRQQGLSAQIHHLERELGVMLFRRSTRKVVLTEAGVAFRERVDGILRELDHAIEEARGASPPCQEVVTVSYTPTVSGEVLGSLLEYAHERLPHIRIGLCETWTPDAVSGVADGRFDLAFARCPTLSESLAAIEIRREPVGVVLAETQPLAAEERVALAALDGLVMAIWERRISPMVYDAMMRAFPSHADPSRHHEMEQFGYETFFGDPVSRREILAGRAFYPTFAGHYAMLPTGFVWRPITPETLIGCTLLHRRDAQRDVVWELIAAAQRAAAEHGWVDQRERVVAA